MTILELVIPGTPVGKGRPRFVKETGRTYTPAKTASYESRVRDAWRAAGSVDLGCAPLRCVLVAVIARPGGHFRVNGDLSAAGLRAPYPVRRPDLDNIVKASLDALCACAFRDDAQVVDVLARRVWAAAGEHEHLRLTLCPMPLVLVPTVTEHRAPTGSDDYERSAA